MIGPSLSSLPVSGFVLAGKGLLWRQKTLLTWRVKKTLRTAESFSES